MQSPRIPLLAGLLSVSWLLAQALDLATLAAAVAVASITAGCALAEYRGRRFRCWLAGVAFALGVTLYVLVLRPPSGSGALVLMLAGAAAAGLLIPLLYAATFSDGDPSP
jgi:CBS-domain-containing membrane protein